MQRAVHHVVGQLRGMEQQLSVQGTDGGVQHVFEFAVLVDNSGSMVRVVDEAKHAMVLVAEVLRRLECRMAIVRFGRAHGECSMESLCFPSLFNIEDPDSSLQFLRPQL
jgi:hypothetical protein